MTRSFTVSPFPITVSICLNVPLTSVQYLVFHISTSETNFLRFISQITAGLIFFLAIHIENEVF